MCTNPSKVPDVGFVACRECWQCRERKVDDWVGRNIAESKTAKAAHVVTLTYGRDPENPTAAGIDHIRAAVLTYSDVQKFLKRLRFHGYPVRYFVVGEYGDKKGRAHWHIILYWQDKVPDVRLRRNIMFPQWEHGWTYWDKMSPQAVRYACKYLVKVMGDENGQIFGPMPSKKPPLGDEYFRQLAADYVKAGLSPQSLFYSFPDVRRVPYGTRANSASGPRKSATPINFLMSGKTADNFCRYFVDGWRERYKDEPPRSDVIWAWHAKKIEAYIDSITLPEFKIRRLLPKPEKAPMGGTTPRRDEVLNTWYSDVHGVRHYWSYDTEGDIGWHEKIGHDPVKARILELRQEEARQAYLIASRGYCPDSLRQSPLS